MQQGQGQSALGRMCVVCARTDRAGEVRSSGFKCRQCIGMPSRPELRRASAAAAFAAQQMLMHRMRPEASAMIRQQQQQQQHRGRRSSVARPAPPEVTHDTRTIRNHVNLLKSTVALVPAAGKACTLQFAVDADVPFRVSLFLACEELGEKEANIRFQAQTTAISRDGAWKVDPVSLPEGTGIRYTSPPLPLGSSKLPAEALRSDAVRAPRRWPLVVQLECSPPGSRARHFQFSYLSLDLAKRTAKIEKQKVQQNGEVFEVEDIFGAVVDGESASPTGGAQTGAVVEPEADGGTECVICLSEPRNTLVMPCRHMCLCEDCAKDLRRQSNSCPICRTAIEGLLHAGSSVSPAPAS
eukprot:TRINITY_DN10599_c0_g1_i1.p1 TRINITY_DN10599_c0_g1~~TRINITY_DN10599_c0_g1_i1.p1  ORF type:complete len:354 (+),score=71.67 TRINITY_DN10599_c0_g1_i1:80-1141(+)